MKQLGVSALVLLATFVSSAAAEESEYKTSDWTKTLRNIKDGVQKLRTYYTSYKYVKYIKPALDLSSGSDGLCRYKCSDGVHKPIARPHYKPSLPDGCSAPVFGFYFDNRIPSMTECCNQHDRCYETCGEEKHDCDDQFHTCLETICRNVQITLGVKQTAQECESAVSLLFNAIVNVGCRPYLDRQGTACICDFSDKEAL